MGSQNKPERLNQIFADDLKKIRIERVQKGLSKCNPKEISFAEMTRLITRTEAYQKVLEELRTKPKKYD